MSFDFTEHPHRRLNPLTGEYVLVSPHRTKRPWQGKQERPPRVDLPQHDPNCYLCPGSTRANGETNPNYSSTFVFTNDFAALMPDAPNPPSAEHPTMQADGVRGTCRVICFSPRHDLTLAEMDLPGIRQVVDLWTAQYAELAQDYTWVQVFENRGEIMGSSNPHPHGQIWALDTLPNEAYKEDVRQAAYYSERGTPLLVDYAGVEAASGERVIVENEHWLAVVPYWAFWPYETLLLPRRQVLRLPDLDTQQRHTLAEILKRLLVKYDNLFEVSFPYSMGWHNAPNRDGDNRHWQLHAHFYPPLLRSATVKKFRVGFEMLGESQRDISPEGAAARLRELPDVHFSERTPTDV